MSACVSVCLGTQTCTQMCVWAHKHAHKCVCVCVCVCVWVCVCLWWWGGVGAGAVCAGVGGGVWCGILSAENHCPSGNVSPFPGQACMWEDNPDSQTQVKSLTVSKELP